MSNGRPHPEDLISAYRDGELAAAEREEAARLLEDSADARTELEDYQSLSELLRGVPEEQAPTGFRAAVMERIGPETTPTSALVRPESGGRGRRFWLIGTLLAGSAAGLVFAIGSFQDRIAKRGERTVAATTRDPAPSGRPAVTRVTSGAAVEGFGRSGGESGTRLSFGVEAVPAEVGHPSVTNSVAAAGRPPADAIPGDVYSYADVTEDGEVIVVEATVVDVKLALNQLQYLLRKSEIRLQETGTEDQGAVRELGVAEDLDGVREAEPARAELGVLVVSDPAQVDAVLKQAREQTDLFYDVRFTGVLDPSSALGRQITLAHVPSDPAAGTMRGAETEDRASLAADPISAADAPVAPRGRASIPDQAFRGAAAPRPAGLSDRPADSAAGAVAPGRSEAAPGAEEAAERGGSDPSGDVDYQQLVKVPKAELASQLQQRSFYKRSEPESLGVGGGLGGGASRYYTGPPESSQIDSYQEVEAESSDLKLQEARQPPAAPKALAQQAPAQQALRKVRLLVLLESQSDKSLKARADGPAAPVEAPQPAPKKG